MKLVKSSSPNSHHWKPFIVDAERQSYSYVLKHNDLPEYLTSTLTTEQLNDWFSKLHPLTSELKSSHNAGGWTDAHYKGEQLLRKTAWHVFDPECTCDYGYSDTWQERISDSRMKDVLLEISEAVVEGQCGLILGDDLDSVNLNYYPVGGGVGWHADDEFLFDGMNQDCLIVSLSLCSGSTEGKRRFEVRTRKSASDDGEENDINKEIIKNEIRYCDLGHGDLMTMEGMFQKHYLHSVWPGDDKSQASHELCQGERINLTWRKIRKHLDGFEECRGKKCNIAGRAN